MTGAKKTRINPLDKKLEELRADFIRISGEPFRHFFCPVLMKDEPAVLCQAHIVNRAFPGASRRWTVQRADVDNFYGAFFEADFVDLRRSDSPLDDALASGFSGHLRPEIAYGGEKISYYVPRSTVPSQHSEVMLEGASGSIRLALKIKPSEMLDANGENWQISIEKDCRLAALVSVLKAAHLAMFEMMGYAYALSAGGLFLGNSVLGKFFVENRGLSKNEVLRNARAHFAQFTSLVRPVLTPDGLLQDTVTDRVLYICEGSTIWALLVFIRTGRRVHAAIVPCMDSPDSAARFAGFLEEQGCKFQARRCQFDGQLFSAAYQTDMFDWPMVTLD